MLNISAGRRDLAIAVIGRAVSSFGDGMALVALVLRLQADGAQPYEVGLLLGAGGLPQLVLAGAVGRLVDRRDSRTLLVWGGLAEVVVTIPLIVIRSTVPVLLLVAALGAATAVTGTTWSALLPRLADTNDGGVARAVSAQQSLTVLALAAAPAAGALLASAFGTGVPVALDAASFVVVTVVGAVVRTRRSPCFLQADADQPANPAAASGFLLLRSDPVLAPLIVGVGLVILLVGMVDVVLVYLVRDTLHAAGLWFGVLEASWMAGMVIGSIAAARLASDHGRVRATVVGAVMVCAALTGYAAAPTVALLVPLALLGGAGNGCAAACLSTLILTRTPDSSGGRVSAATTVVFGGAQGMSLLAGSFVSLVLTPRAIVAVAGLLGLTVTAVIASTRATAHHTADTVTTAPR